MTEKYVLVFDIGTTGNKTIIFDLKGNVIGEAGKEYPLIFPSAGAVDQNANDWWKATIETCQQATKNANIDTESIVSVCVTNQRETTVPVNTQGKPLRNAIVWQDRRTIKQCDYIREKIGAEKIYQLTGLTIDPYFSLPKMLWIKENEPDIFAKTHKFLLVHDFIQYQLTGKFVTDHSNASRTMLFDINKQTWSEEISNLSGIPMEMLPQALPPGQQICQIQPKIAKLLKLSENTVVITGAGDQQCAALGVGVTYPGLVKTTTGTGTFILTFLDKPQFEPQRRLLCSCHAIPNKWVMEASIFNSGTILRWFRDNLCYDLVQQAQKEGRDVYNSMTDLAKNIPIGSEGLLLLPYFTGAGAPKWDPFARGMFAGLFLGHTRGHMIRSILEGVAYEIRENLELMGKTIGKNSTEIRITGGGAKSSLWNQIVSDVCNVVVKKTKFAENTALGAAILAATGAGLYPSIDTAAAKMISIAESSNPDSKNYHQYTQYYQLSRNLYNENKQLFRELQNIKECK